MHYLWIGSHLIFCNWGWIISGKGMWFTKWEGHMNENNISFFSYAFYPTLLKSDTKRYIMFHSLLKITCTIFKILPPFCNYIATLPSCCNCVATWRQYIATVSHCFAMEFSVVSTGVATTLRYVFTMLPLRRQWIVNTLYVQLHTRNFLVLFQCLGNVVAICHHVASKLPEKFPLVWMGLKSILASAFCV